MMASGPRKRVHLALPLGHAAHINRPFPIIPMTQPQHGDHEGAPAVLAGMSLETRAAGLERHAIPQATGAKDPAKDVTGHASADYGSVRQYWTAGFVSSRRRSHRQPTLT